MTYSIMEWQKKVTEVAISKGGNWKPTDIDTMLLRLHSEVSEASEAIRDNNLTKLAEELADIFIRLVNCAEVMGVDLEQAAIIQFEAFKKRPYLHRRARK